MDANRWMAGFAGMLFGLLLALGQVGAAAAQLQPPTALWLATYFDNPDLAGPPVAGAFVRSVDFDWGNGAPTQLVPSEAFSARYVQSLDLPEGFHALRAQADDGVRLFVNDDLVIDEWHLGTPAEYRAGRQLSGPTTFRVEYFEAGGEASVRFDYELVDEFPAWRAVYYDNISLTDPPAWVQPEDVDVDAQLSHQWSLNSPVPGVIPEDNWSARWTGTYGFEAGDYVFRAEATDGVRVRLDDRLLIDEWSDGANEAEVVFQDLGAGPHTVIVEYYARGGVANLKVEWDRILE